MPLIAVCGRAVVSVAIFKKAGMAALTPACNEYNKFVADYPNYDVDVKLWAFSAKEMQEAQKVFGSMIWSCRSYMNFQIIPR